jgi:hypothetical protein
LDEFDAGNSILSPMHQSATFASRINERKQAKPLMDGRLRSIAEMTPRKRPRLRNRFNAWLVAQPAFTFRQITSTPEDDSLPDGVLALHRKDPAIFFGRKRTFWARIAFGQ